MSNVIKFTPRTIKVYYCDVCKQPFEWGSNSHLYGSVGHQDIGARQFKVCSNQCRKKAPSILDMEYIIGDYGRGVFTIAYNGGEADIVSEQRIIDLARIMEDEE